MSCDHERESQTITDCSTAILNFWTCPFCLWGFVGNFIGSAFFSAEDTRVVNGIIITLAVFLILLDGYVVSLAFGRML
jgi:hypothetical protein